MSMSSHLLKRAIVLWKNGQKGEARKIFEVIIYNDRRNEDAWIWYVYTLRTNREKIAALENFLSVFPNHTAGEKALANLKAQAPQSSIPKVNVQEKSSKAKKVHEVKSLPIQNIRPTQQPKPRTRLWIVAILGLCFLLSSSIIFLSRYDSLQSKYKNLIVESKRVTGNYAQLQQDFQRLESKNTTLTNEYNTMAARYNSLSTEYSILRGNYDSLYAEHTQMLAEYNTLTGNYNALNNIALKPPYIVVHDRKVDTTFYDIDGQLITWSTPFAGLEYAIEAGTYMRRLIVDNESQTILADLANGSSIWVRDFSMFVTPETFQNVVPELYYKSSSPHEFIYRLWYMIGQLSNYTDEELETPRYSLETLLAGGGDCEDLSILLASMVKAAPVDWYVDLVYVDSKNLNNPQGLDHVVVYIDTGQETFIVETTSDQDMLPYENGLTGWLAGDLHSDNQNLHPVYLH